MWNANSDKEKKTSHLRIVHLNASPGAAVVVKNGTKSYKSGIPVLSGINMVVNSGSIYALLGSSGCGKTTMLSCMVGIRKLDSGEILIYGNKPGARSIGIPGKNIGYMPQETSLYMEFTIEELMIYFGGLSGMNMTSIKSELRFYLKFLQLPNSDYRISSLSGGQQRRLSFAMAMMHNPQLLILDEPTIGVDPIIRQRIWNHLASITTNKNATVIITTHYIEEARQADTIGVMRNGKILVEQPPHELLAEFNENSLENVVLKLCRLDGVEGEIRSGPSSSSILALRVVPSKLRPISATIANPVESSCMDSLKRVAAFTGKNFRILYRNKIFLWATLFGTAFVIGLMCACLGNDPTNLPFGLVNHELNYTAACPKIQPYRGSCHIKNLSCRFLNNIPKKYIDLKLFNTDEEAVAATQSGEIWGFLNFQRNFSADFFIRSTSPTNTVDEMWNKSDIIVRMDDTSKIISNKIKKTLKDAFEDFISDLLTNCGINKALGENPLQYRNPPLFGKDGTDNRVYYAVAAAPCLVSFFAVIPASIRLIKEKKNGVTERTLVLGAYMWEMIVGYTISEACVLIAQSTLIHLMFVYGFRFEILGSHILSVSLTILCGFFGIKFGFTLGTLCSEEMTAGMLSLVFFTPMMLLYGLLWPAEGVVEWLQPLSKILPCTQAATAIRSIVTRGWEFDHPVVWLGFAIPAGYAVFFFLLTVLACKVKN